MLPYNQIPLIGSNQLGGNLWNDITAVDSSIDHTSCLNTIGSANGKDTLITGLEPLPIVDPNVSLNHNWDTAQKLLSITPNTPSLTSLIPIDMPIVPALTSQVEAVSDPLTGVARSTPLNGSIKINFQTSDSTVPAGYIADSGQAYSKTHDFGWVREDSLSSPTHIPLNITANARDRGRVGIDPQLNTLLHMQYPTDIFNPTAVKTPAAWEYALPSGTYSVTVSVGDQPNRNGLYNSLNTINVEGVNAISHFRSSTVQEYEQATVEATVNDGRLTIDAIGGKNTKINYVEIKPTQATFTVPVSDDVSVYLKPKYPNANLNENLYRGGLFSGVDGGLTASPARFYLQFKLPTFVPGTQVTSATITGYYNDDYNQADDDLHGIYFVGSDSWSESTLTWNNQPGQTYGLSEAKFDPANATTGTFISWDIAPIVNQEYQGDGVLSLLFHANKEGLYAANQNWE